MNSFVPLYFLFKKIGKFFVSYLHLLFLLSHPLALLFLSKYLLSSYSVKSPILGYGGLAVNDKAPTFIELIF